MGKLIQETEGVIFYKYEGDKIYKNKINDQYKNKIGDVTILSAFSPFAAFCHYFWQPSKLSLWWGHFEITPRVVISLYLSLNLKPYVGREIYEEGRYWNNIEN